MSQRFVASMHKLGGSLDSRFLVVCLILLGCFACQKRDEKSRNAHPEKAGLRIRSVPDSVQAGVYPVEGTRDARPVVVVLSELPKDCRTVRHAYGGRAHVLCSRASQPDEDQEVSERRIYEALSFLKLTYSEYVAGSPVHLFSSSNYSKLALRMLLREPRVFAYCYLEGAQASALSASIFVALADRGTRILLLGDKFSARTASLATAARRRGLWTAAVGRGEVGLDRAVRTFVRADPRLEQANLGK